MNALKTDRSPRKSASAEAGRGQTAERGSAGEDPVGADAGLRKEGRRNAGPALTARRRTHESARPDRESALQSLILLRQERAPTIWRWPERRSNWRRAVSLRPKRRRTRPSETWICTRSPRRSMATCPAVGRSRRRHAGGTTGGQRVRSATLRVDAKYRRKISGRRGAGGRGGHPRGRLSALRLKGRVTDILRAGQFRVQHGAGGRRFRDVHQGHPAGAAADRVSAPADLALGPDCP